MDFLSLVLQCSFLPSCVGFSPELPLDAPGIVLQTGVGGVAKTGDRITLDYWIQDENGKEIANSERRGLTQTFYLFGPTSDPLLSGAALGARSGEERLVVLMAEEWYAEISAIGLIRNPGPISIRIRVLEVVGR